MPPAGRPRDTTQHGPQRGSTSRVATGRGQYRERRNHVSRFPHNARGNDRRQATMVVENVKEGLDDREKVVPVRPMPFWRLQELMRKDPTEVLLVLKKDEFFLLLQKKNEFNIMAHILIALGKACEAVNVAENLGSFINRVTNIGSFFIEVQRYLAAAQRQVIEQCHKDSLHYLVEFLKKFQSVQPSTATDMLTIVMPLLKATISKVLQDLGACVLLEKIDDIEKQNDYHLETHAPVPGEIERLSRQERLQRQDPPEDFRTVPVLPNDLDIHGQCSFLRPNVIKGSYFGTEHYLDVQYRLLREDYISPLRDGIAEYLRIKKSGKTVKHIREARVYENVRVVKQDFVNGRLVHFAQFNIDNFKNVKWEYNKRFLTGALLCLSSDDFQTMLFASVARREPKDLQKGVLLLRFEDITDEVLNLNHMRSFVIIETDSYFEAYRYNLQALHLLNDNNLPLKQYIVEVQGNIQSPKYLTNGISYDMRPLFLPLETSLIKHETNRDKTVTTRYEFTSTRYSSVSVLEDKQWPTADELGLDFSQYGALKNAITKEFAVIQGPPGTGKTYVGLRIVQLLLHNIDKWHHYRNDHSPILVVCYTNHALDQFLEGTLSFTHRIVRIGGRGTNEELANYQLNNLKNKIKERREVPSYIFSSIKQKNWELRSLRRDIDEVNQIIEKSYTNILDEYVLRDSMISENVDHYDTLKSPFGVPGDYKINLTMQDWLGLVVKMQKTPRSHNEVSVAGFGNLKEIDVALKGIENAENIIGVTLKDIENAAYGNEEADNYEEADIEYIEAQRNVDDEEYADVLYDIEEEVIEEEEYVLEDGWQIQGGKKGMRQYIKRNLDNNDIMTEEEAEQVYDVWQLQPMENRWRLYKLWLNRYIKEKKTEILGLQQRFRRECAELCELRSQEDLYVLKNAHIVGMTTTGAAKYRTIVQELNPRIVVVEEAAEILESHIVTSLAPNTQHIILIGDHQQLQPSPTVYRLAVKYKLNVSLFERMVSNGMECHRLSVQHRMRPEIAALLVPHIYEDLLNHESVTKFENIKGIEKDVFFVSHSFSENQEYDSKSRVNEHEAKFMIKLCQHLILQGYDSSQITILTTYSGQLFELRKLAKGKIVQNVRITVVDNFQGEENDIILMSFVRSNEDGIIGFLKVSNRVCVALSRAKKALYCIGNFNLLAEKSDLWKDIVGMLNLQKSIGTSLKLVCQNHPAVSSMVASERDFATVPEGGCTKPCEYRLACGHTCSLVCHPYDPEHEKMKCQKDCTKVLCKFEHPCRRRCNEKCGNCTVLMPKKLPDCQHTIQVQCYLLNTEIPCTKKCDRPLKCSHQCRKMCREQCATQCEEYVNIESVICGHQIRVQCYKSANPKAYILDCKEPCRAQQSCEHLCSGTCGQCRQGRLHISCSQKCKRILVCGHECKSLCSRNCPPCNRKCENRCIHSRCPKKCGVPCDPCNEPCNWFCKHKQCTKLCFEACDRTPCNEPCTKLLKCKHLCIGLCGEPCPKLCRTCQNEKVTEIFFGSEDEEDARFVLLEDCKHMFTVNELTQWLEESRAENGEIQMKSCPRCKTVIRKNLRFGNVIKSGLNNIEKVKRITYGDVNKNENDRRSLLRRMEGSGCDYNFFAPMIRVLSSNLKRSVQELATLDNMFSVGLKYIDTSGYSNIIFDIELILSRTMDEIVKGCMERFIEFMRETEKIIVDFIQDEYLTASEQKFQEIIWEISRLKFCNNFFQITKTHYARLKPNANFIDITDCLTKYGPFRKADEDRLKTALAELCQSLGSAVINISQEEKSSVLKAMNLSSGHWYQCPNGHVYCITECGGAMVESKCNECGVQIGGSHHTLLSSNRVATDMDGARHAAWSENQNLGNFQI